MASSRVNISSRSPWEPLRGYSRAVHVDDRVLVSGTTALSESGDVIGIGDPYRQTKYIIDRVRSVLSECGFTMQDVVRTRMFITDMKLWQEYAKAHSEAFSLIRPASSIVEVSRLVDPRLMIEMECEAIKIDGKVTSKSLG